MAKPDTDTTTSWNAPGSAMPIILAFVLVIIAGVLARPLIPIDETRYLSVAWEMYLNGDYLVPHKNGDIYTHKPPLLFWLINIVWAVTGVSEFAARLVAPAFAVASLFLTGMLARRLWPEIPQVGTRAAIILASMSVFLIYGGGTVFDAMLTFAALLGTLALVGTSRGNRWRDWVLLGVAIALGVFAKGPVILVHLAPVVLAYPLWADPATRPPPARLATGLLTALGVALLIVALWLVPAILAGGEEYRNAILWTQSAGRVVSSFAHARPWWYFVAILPVLLFPWIWSPNILRALAHLSWREPGFRLCAIWIGGATILFSLISGKQVHYLVPELAPAAIILARATVEITPKFRWNAAAIPIAIVAAVAIAAGIGILAVNEELAPLLKPRAMLVPIGLLLAAMVWISLRIGDFRGSVLLGLGSVLVFNLLVAFTELRPVYDAGRIGNILSAHEDGGVATYASFYNADFNFTGRLKNPVALLSSAAEIEDWISTHPDGVIFGRLGAKVPKWPASETILYRNKPHAIWFVADRPGTGS